MQRHHMVICLGFVVGNEINVTAIAFVFVCTCLILRDHAVREVGTICVDIVMVMLHVTLVVVIIWGSVMVMDNGEYSCS